LHWRLFFFFGGGGTFDFVFIAGKKAGSAAKAGVRASARERRRPSGAKVVHGHRGRRRGMSRSLNF